MNERTPKVLISPLSQAFTADGITVDVQIYRIEGVEGWTLELVDGENVSITWTDPFPSDQEAWDEFASGVQMLGLKALLEIDDNDDEGTTVH